VKEMKKSHEEKKEDPAYAYKVWFNSLPAWRRNPVNRISSHLGFYPISFLLCYGTYKLLDLFWMFIVLIIVVPIISMAILRIFPDKRWYDPERNKCR
jgi:hypothetical protein